MAKTRWSVITALILIGVSVALMLGRWYSLGAEIDGPPGWRVTLEAQGQLLAKDASVTTVRPIDFRHQHISKESYQSSDLRYRLWKRKAPGQRKVVWRTRLAQGKSQPFQLTYAFSCTMTAGRTSGMTRRTTRADAEPTDASTLKPTPLIQCDHPDITRRAQASIEHGMDRSQQVRAFFDYVKELQQPPPSENPRGQQRSPETVERAPKPESARGCLRNQGGSAAARSRLLVALCRNRGIHARLVSGLVLGDTREEPLHYWAEAWVHDHWLPMCPTFGRFGPAEFQNYLVLLVGGSDPVRGRHVGNLQYHYQVENLHAHLGAAHFGSASALKTLWRKLSLQSLRPAEQNVVKFLLLLPLGGLIVSIFRTLIGVPTFGTFSPALLGLAFLDLRALPWGLGIFVLTVLVGWLLRRGIERYHLLLVPRTAILLTLIVLFLIVVITIASHYDVAVTNFIALFPLVILTHLVERFWTVEAEDGTAASFKTLLGTLLVAVTISVVLSPEAVTRWLFRFPETLGVVLGVLFLIGRYTGYRVSELYRFQDLIVEGHASGPEKGTGPLSSKVLSPFRDPPEKPT